MRFILPALALVATVAAYEEEQAAASISKNLWVAFIGVLDDPELQVADVAGALVFGLLLLKGGEFNFKLLATAATGIVAMLLTLSEVSVSLGEGYQHIVRRVIGMAVCLGTAFVAWEGFDGVLLGFAAMFGVFVAHKTQFVLSLMQADTDSVAYPWMVVGWYSVFVLACMCVAHLKKSGKLLALVAPFLGGALTSSALSWIATYLSLHGHMDFLVKLVPQQQPGELGTWLDFLMLLTDADSKDVGVFANTHFDRFSGKNCADRVVGQSVWFFLFLIGTFYQYNRVVKSGEQQKFASKVVTLNAPFLKDHV